MRFVIETRHSRWVWEWSREDHEDDPPEAYAQGSTAETERASRWDFDTRQPIGFASSPPSDQRPSCSVGTIPQPNVGGRPLAAAHPVAPSRVTRFTGSPTPSDARPAPWRTRSTCSPRGRPRTTARWARSSLDPATGPSVPEAFATGRRRLRHDRNDSAHHSH